MTWYVRVLCLYYIIYIFVKSTCDFSVLILWDSLCHSFLLKKIQNKNRTDLSFDFVVWYDWSGHVHTCIFWHYLSHVNVYITLSLFKNANIKLGSVPRKVTLVLIMYNYHSSKLTFYLIYTRISGTLLHFFLDSSPAKGRGILGNSCIVPFFIKHPQNSGIAPIKMRCRTKTNKQTNKHPLKKTTKKTNKKQKQQQQTNKQTNKKKSKKNYYPVSGQ